MTDTPESRALCACPLDTPSSRDACSIHVHAVLLAFQSLGQELRTNLNFAGVAVFNHFRNKCLQGTRSNYSTLSQPQPGYETDRPFRLVCLSKWKPVHLTLVYETACLGKSKSTRTNQTHGDMDGQQSTFVYPFYGLICA